MAAFVVLTWDMLELNAVGPFEDDDAAVAWIGGLPPNPLGGSARYVVVSEDTATNPAEYVSDLVELYGQEFEEAVS